MSLGRVKNARAWGAYFNALEGLATNEPGGIFWGLWERSEVFGVDEGLIAGKPAPTFGLSRVQMWERALPAMAILQPPIKACGYKCQCP